MVNVLISGDTRYPVNRKVIRKAVSDVFAKHKIENMQAEVSVSVVGRRKMKELSVKYLDETDPESHEVLTFALEEIDQDAGFVNSPDEVLRLGDVVLCWPGLIEVASRESALVDDEVYSLTSHGVEHLLGEHHQ